MKNIDKNKMTVGGINDYIKAIKIADREMGLGNGFTATHKVFKNKKAYDRKRDKKVAF